MTKPLLNPEEEAYLRELIPGRRPWECAKLVRERFGKPVTDAFIQNFMHRKHIRNGLKGKPGTMETGTKMYPPEVFRFIVENNLGKSAEEITKAVNDAFGTEYTVRQLKAFRKNRKLDSETGEGRFQKGHVPWSKGMKGLKIPGSEKTWFQKGHIAHNNLPIGSERMHAGTLCVKVKDGEKNDNFKSKSHVVWEREHGKLKDGEMVIFLDGDVTNCAAENLLAIQKSENSVMNVRKQRSENPEITMGHVLANRIDRRIKELTKERNQHDDKNRS